MVITLTFQEVESGFMKTVKTLDGRQLTITSVCGEIDNENYFDTILGEGMPIDNSELKKGQLFIMYNVNKE